MDGKGSDDSGERYPYASEPVETEDSQPPSPAIGYALHLDDVEPFGRPADPLDPATGTPNQELADDSGDELGGNGYGFGSYDRDLLGRYGSSTYSSGCIALARMALVRMALARMALVSHVWL